jgi:hypothetical protein
VANGCRFPKDTTQTDILALDLAVKNTDPGDLDPRSYGRIFGYTDARRQALLRRCAWKKTVTNDFGRFPLDRSDNGRLEFPKIYNVGYHCWLRDTLVALFIVGENEFSHTPCRSWAPKAKNRSAWPRISGVVC